MTQKRTSHTRPTPKIIKDKQKQLKARQKQLKEYTTSQKLKQENRQLKREVKRLRKIVSTQKDESIFLADTPDAASGEGTLHQAEQVAFIDFKKKKWKCFKCGFGFLLLMVIRRMDGEFYFRKCDDCSHRTPMKRFHSKIEGLREDEVAQSTR
mgnify:CR=1 FL=1